MRLMVPAVLAASVNQLNALIGSVLASLLAVGSVSWLYYADRIMELPVGLVAIALGTVLLPSLSRLHAGHETERFRAALDWGSASRCCWRYRHRWVPICWRGR